MTQLARLPQANSEGLQLYLEHQLSRLEATLPAHVTPQRVIQLLSVLTFQNPKIAQCVPESIVTSLVTVAALDLDLTRQANEAFLIPRNNKKIEGPNKLECQFQIGYKGLEKLAVRTGAVLRVIPHVVRDADLFEVWEDETGSHFKHRKCLDPRKRGRVTHYYAVARFADGRSHLEVMTADEVEAIHRRTQSYQYAVKDQKPEEGPWATDYDEMGLKTVVRKTCKRLPRAQTDARALEAWAALDKAIAIDDETFEAIEGLTDRSAQHFDNQTGYGRTGAYAPPEAVAEWQAWAKAFVTERNGQWADSLTKLHGDIPVADGDLLTVPDVEETAIFWGRDAVGLQAPERPTVDQRSKLAAVAWVKGRDGLVEYLNRYARMQWRERKAALTAREEASERPKVDASELGPELNEDADPEMDFETSPESTDQ